MVARATLADIDTVRMSVDDAVELFRESVLPALNEQEGYRGVYVFLSPEGQVLVMSFWETEEAAEAGLAGAAASTRSRSRNSSRSTKHLPGATCTTSCSPRTRRFSPARRQR